MDAAWMIDARPDAQELADIESARWLSEQKAAARQQLESRDSGPQNSSRDGGRQEPGTDALADAIDPNIADLKTAQANMGECVTHRVDALIS